jgi:hypothetical protein
MSWEVLLPFPVWKIPNSFSQNLKSCCPEFVSARMEKFDRGQVKKREEKNSLCKKWTLCKKGIAQMSILGGIRILFS